MKSKIKSPKHLSELKAADYKMRLKTDLNVLKVAKKMPRFFFKLNHTFADGKEGPLLICGITNSWKAYVKDFVTGTDKALVITGTCSLSESEELALVIEKGKAKKDKVKKAFKKNSILKKMALTFEGAIEIAEMSEGEAAVKDAFYDEFHGLYQEPLENKDKQELKELLANFKGFQQNSLLSKEGKAFEESIKGDEEATAKFQKLKTRTQDRITSITERLKNNQFAAKSNLSETTDLIGDSKKLKKSGKMTNVLNSLQSIKDEDENGLTLDFKIQQASASDEKALLDQKLEKLAEIKLNTQKWLKKNKKGSLIESKKAKAQRIKQFQAMTKLLQQLETETIEATSAIQLNQTQVSQKEAIQKSKKTKSKNAITKAKNLIKDLPGYHENNSFEQNKVLIENALKNEKTATGEQVHSAEKINIEIFQYKLAETVATSNDLEVIKRVSLELLQARIEALKADGETNLGQDFRGADLLSATVTDYLDSKSSKYKEKIVGKIESIMNAATNLEEGVYEIDPQKLQDIGKENLLADNTKKLTAFYRKIVNSAIGPNALQLLSPEAKAYCKEIYLAAGGNSNKKGAQDVVVGFIYLRVVNPLFMYLRTQLDADNPANIAANYASKLLQNQANQITRPTKEPHLVPFSPLLEEYDALMKATIAGLVDDLTEEEQALLTKEGNAIGEKKAIKTLILDKKRLAANAVKDTNIMKGVYDREKKEELYHTAKEWLENYESLDDEQKKEMAKEAVSMQKVQDHVATKLSLDTAITVEMGDIINLVDQYNSLKDWSTEEATQLKTAILDNITAIEPKIKKVNDDALLNECNFIKSLFQ